MGEEMCLNRRMKEVMGIKNEGEKGRILKTIAAEEMLKGEREMILKRRIQEREVTGRKIIVLGGAGLQNPRKILEEREVTGRRIIVVGGAGLLSLRKIQEDQDGEVLTVEGQG